MRLRRLVFASCLLVAFPSWAVGGERASLSTGGTGLAGAPSSQEDVPPASVDVPAETASATASSPSSPAVRQLTLASRLRVVLDPDPTGPDVSVCTSVDAGARRDPVDAPGAARLLAEALVLGGFPTPGQNRADFLAARGVRSELSPDRDLMTFCTTGPAVELPLVLWVTAGRFSSLALTADARASAIERLSQTLDARDADVIDGRAPVRLRQMVLLGTPAYAHPELVDLHELEAIELPRLRRLHEEAYGALSAVVTVSGSFEPEVAARLLPEQLSRVRTGAAPGSSSAELVTQSTPRFSMAEDPRVKSPSAFYAWLVPEQAPRADLELALLTLTGPGRLGQKMVGPGKAARDVRVSVDAGRGPGLVSLRVSGTGPQSLGTIEKQLEQELRALATVAPSVDELNQAQERLRESRLRLLADPKGRARSLSEGLLRGSPPSEVLSVLDEGQKTSAPDGEAVRLAAARYFIPSRQSTIEIYPKGWQDPWQVPMPVFHIVSAGETLTSIAKQHRTTVQAITKMNGLREKTPIYPGDKLKVPRGKHHEEAKLRTHVVRRGDTLSALGLKYGVSARAIAEQNGMSVKQAISVGETLRIPSSDGGKGSDGASGGSKGSPRSDDGASGSAASKKNVYVVQGGETLGGIAIKLGVRLAALATANGLTTKSMVRVGQELVVPTDAAARRADVPKTSNYAVKSGDTLSGVAKKHGVTVTELERLNGINRKATLRVGQTLKIPAKD